MRTNLRRIKSRLGNKKQTPITSDEVESLLNAFESLSHWVEKKKERALALSFF